MNVIKPSASMRSRPNIDAYLETECLFGEKLEILSNDKEWSFCKLLTDNYCGWVQNTSLGKTNRCTHRVLTLRTFIFTEKHVKSKIIYNIPIGSKLNVIKTGKTWSEITLPKKFNFQIGYVPSKHIVNIKNKVKDWVSVAEQFLNAPYKWGGRNSLGIDCSALIQLSCEAYGKALPRNTNDQLRFKDVITKDLNSLKRADIIFWRGHVGVMVDSLNILHANAFHMKTVIEPLNDVILRMSQECKIIKVISLAC